MRRELTSREVSDIARTNTRPISVPRSIRQVDQVVATSIRGGVVAPIAAFPLLREDTLKSSMLHAKVDIMESAEVIKNGIQVRFQVWFVPTLAFERFGGSMDAFNRSYMKQPARPGDAVLPFFRSTFGWPDGSIPIHKALGFHHVAADVFNTCYIEAYNTIYNFRLRNRSESLYASQKVDVNANVQLKPAFWQHEQYKYVVPDWDDLAMEGSVDLTFTNANAAIRGIGVTGGTGGVGVNNVKETSGVIRNYGKGRAVSEAGNGVVIEMNSLGEIPAIYADMASAGIKISLANIELAKKSQWYARLKAQFEGLPDQFVVDMLMQGMTVSDEMWKQPIKLADKTEYAGVTKRWATDAANLTDAVVNGSAMCDLDIVMPRCPTGGVIMVTAEILPEQLFERARDPMLFTLDPDKLPNAMRDDLDPQKVERMANVEIDTSHADPNGLFGYRPMNWLWQSSNTRIGGKWFKTAPSDVFNEERMHFWTVEKANPTLGPDFMIAQTFNQLPFVVTNQDIGEVELVGTAVIEGNTVFGERLLEQDNSYAEVLAEVDQSRLVKGQ